MVRCSRAASLLRYGPFCLSCRPRRSLSSVAGDWRRLRRLLRRPLVKKELTQFPSARSAISSSSGVERVASAATHIHRACEQMHDDIAAAENGDSQDYVEGGFSQSFRLMTRTTRLLPFWNPVNHAARAYLFLLERDSVGHVRSLRGTLACRTPRRISCSSEAS